ncbi:metallophosphoesterase family protein [Halorussus halobius]|uniref:metallophosphoesterase family protein n=1 Tax=Halorussus halobius TaxID=1710537 RepID=UPI00109329A3|nr:metallophosphoesterase [Halorussus halobius]
MTGPAFGRLDRPTADATRFAVVADPHVSTRAEGTSKLFEHTRDHFEAALEDISDRNVDAVLSPGDLTKDGEPWNYEAVDDALDRLDAPFYAVPGNHDVAKDGDDHDALAVTEFADRYGAGEFPYRVRVGDVDVVGVNTAGTADRLFGTHGGRVDAAQRDRVAELLDGARNPVVVAHHNLPAVSDQLDRHREAVEPEMTAVPGLRDPGPFAETLAAGGASVVFTGHYHLPAFGEYRDVREVATPTTCSFPQSYLLCDVTDEGLAIRLVPVADDVGLETAHAKRATDSVTARGLTTIASARLAAMPLVDEH